MKLATLSRISTISRLPVHHGEHRTFQRKIPMSHRLIPVAICLLFFGLVAHRIWRYASFEQQTLQMPPQVIDAEEQTLFLSPAGNYSLTDIASNGSLLPAQKYSGFRAQHDYRPQSGDHLCPITRTKAHSECTWIVGGQTYEFCCPPCIAEFVRQAKEQPESILPPQAYVRK